MTGYSGITQDSKLGFIMLYIENSGFWPIGANFNL
jgi:hypothetical protein